MDEHGVSDGDTARICERRWRGNHESFRPQVHLLKRFQRYSSHEVRARKTIIAPFNDFGVNSVVQVTDCSPVIAGFDSSVDSLYDPVLSVIGPTFHALRRE